MAKLATLQDIASNLGLSKTTISVALRGRPGVSDEVRARIMAEAKRLGYEPNPADAELMALVRARRHLDSGKTIAFINTFRQDPTLLKRIRGFRQFFEGAVEQAKRFGYRIDEFRIGDAGMSSARLDQVLKARSICGVLIGPRWFDEPEIVLDWPAYSCVLIGETSCNAGIHRVCNHHPQTIELALTRMAALGYKRIGIELPNDFESVRHFQYTAGVNPAERIVSGSARFFINVTPHFTPEPIQRAEPEERDRLTTVYQHAHELPRLQEWVQRNRLDALVTIANYDYHEIIRHIKTANGRKLAYACLDVTPEENTAGINQHPDDIGRAAMDLLRALLHSGERGISPRPRIVLVEGEWIDGPSAPPVFLSRKRRSKPVS